MDPANTIVSDKLLLSDIDLRIISPSSTVSYGNNRPGDEVNNVEQVMISTPSTGTYSVVLRSKVFTEVVNQPVSLIITSGGTVSNKVISTTSSSYPKNEISCSSGQQMITLDLLDRGGNGWGSGNSFVIQDASESTTYHTFTMNGDVGKDSSQEQSVCLTEGVKYVAKFIQNGSNKKEMGVTIPQCSVYLSSDVTSQLLDLTTSSLCNPCPSSKFLLNTALYGPAEGIPYGWKDDSRYTLLQSLDVNTTVVITTGTLTTGVKSSRNYCLGSGVYYLEFDGVPDNDDIYVAGSVGVSSYRIEVSNCGAYPGTIATDDMFDDDLFPFPRVQPGHGFKITIHTGLTCSLQYVDDSREPVFTDDDNAAVSFLHLTRGEMMIGFFLGILSLLLIV
jgi:hypothetical protein